MLEVVAAVVALLAAGLLGVGWLWFHGFFDRGLPGYRRKDHELIEEAGNVGRSNGQKRE